MANHGRAFGMSADIQRAAAAKYDPVLEKEAQTWLESLTGQKMTGSFAEWLKDGKVLCAAMNVLKPGSVPKINDQKMAFKQMENISNFITAASAYGMAITDQFQTVDLYEAKNLGLVVNGIHALGRAAQKNNFRGPVIGAKESSASKRDFTEEQLKAGHTIIPGQAGYTGGATQAGMTPTGKTRHM